jgi:hypothetical protein
LFTTELLGSLPMRVPPSWWAPGAPAGLTGARQFLLCAHHRPISSIFFCMNSTRARSLGRRQS